MLADEQISLRANELSTCKFLPVFNEYEFINVLYRGTAIMV
jgi:hypothetical protein